MYGRYVARALAVALVGVTAGLGSAPAWAGDAAGSVPVYGGPQFMVYLSWPVGARGIGASTFGLRYERTAPVYTDSAGRFSAPLRHHSLIELEFTRGATPRMLFGPRVTWDLARGQLGPTRLVNATWQLTVPAPVTTLPTSWTP